VKLNTLIKHRFFQPVSGAALAALCGLALWAMPLGEAWQNASYDYLFRFGSRMVTNQLVIIEMDNAAHDALGQIRAQWDRRLHAELLDRLKEGGCPLVVFDVFFVKSRDQASDHALADAMRRHGRVVLASKPADIGTAPSIRGFEVRLHTNFLEAASGNWGFGKVHAEVGEVARRHWPFPAPVDNYPSLAWKAAQLAGARLSEKAQEQWLRYYGNGAWTSLSYHLALSNAPNYFSNKVVFIGSKPEKPEDLTFREDDKFRPVPMLAREEEKAIGGVEILATEFLNLMNRDWLRRPPAWFEVLLLIVTGGLLTGFYALRPVAALSVACAVALVVMLGAITLSYYTHYWFPWLLISGGQVPCALARGVLSRWHGEGIVSSYEVAKEPFGRGAYGEVFLARHKKSGQWFAFKKVYRAKFNDPGPYEREFRGITRYLPVSSRHPGLLQVHYVGRDEREAQFFYVMELGDSQCAGWERSPATFKPCDLANVRARAEGRRLPVQECVRIALALAKALDFLHQQGLIHRDIKPANVIFVNGQPKLADIGLVAEIQPPGEESWIGTPGYMPPPPEAPGTLQADIYALGMLLYVISTGLDPALFPELSTTLVEKTSEADFIHLNPVILKACQPNQAQRYASAAEMHAALLNILKALPEDATTQQA